MDLGTLRSRGRANRLHFCKVFSESRYLLFSHRSGPAEARVFPELKDKYQHMTLAVTLGLYVTYVSRIPALRKA